MPQTSRIVPSVMPDAVPPRTVTAEFRAALRTGMRLAPAGEAKHDPEGLLAAHPPRHRLRLFGASYWLSDRRFDADIGFFVGYVALAGSPRIHPRIFYKDSSLVWRVATHLVRTQDENWIGKGEVRWQLLDGEEVLCSAEETTNLPFEIQGALDVLDRRGRKRRDDEVVDLVLRRAATDRLEPYADFTTPMRRARAQSGLKGMIAWFARPRDPRSLVFRAGFEPDFARGLIDVQVSASRLYGGEVRKFRIVSRNSRVQYQFVASPTHVWLNPPQALTTELTTYGVRALDVLADEHLFVPGYEYHFYEDGECGGELHSQIPHGYAGDPSPIDPDRADASAWIEALPVVREFRRKVLRA